MKRPRSIQMRPKPLRKQSKPEHAKRQPSSREKVRAHRARLRKRGLRLVQMWVPDTRSAEFARQAHRDCLAIAQSEHDTGDQAWVDAMSWWNSPEARAFERREAKAQEQRHPRRKRK